MEAYEFPIVPGAVIPRDCGYVLLAALSTAHSFLHGREDIQIAPVRGTRLYDRPSLIRMDHKSVLHIRGISAQEAEALAHTWLRVDNAILALEKPRIRTLTPSSFLTSRSVVLEDKFNAEDVRESVQSLVGIGTVQVGRSQGLRMHGRHFKGFHVCLSDLDMETSSRVQSEGIGRFTSMGCGVFYPGAVRYPHISPEIGHCHDASGHVEHPTPVTARNTD